MARWHADTSNRLSIAALQLFATRGFEETTVEQIAAEAGVTARTFFRHFADKEEVLFSSDEAMSSLLVSSINASIEALDPEEAVMTAMLELAATFEGDRPEHQLRARVLEQSPKLLGRQLLKQDRWARTAVDALVEYDIDDTSARMVVGRAALVFSTAYRAWVDGRPGDLVEHFDRCRRILDHVSAQGLRTSS
jgi:AcrR family transcriptional regulator